MSLLCRVSEDCITRHFAPRISLGRYVSPRPYLYIPGQRVKTRTLSTLYVLWAN